jgi:hypothetical protein
MAPVSTVLPRQQACAQVTITRDTIYGSDDVSAAVG